MRFRTFVRESVLACVVSGLMLPGAIAVATVLLFLTNPQGKDPRFVQWDGFVNGTRARACLFGALIGLGFCLLLAVIACRPFTRANSACPGPYDQLRQGLDDVDKRLTIVCADSKTPPPPPAVTRNPPARSGHRGSLFLALLAILAFWRVPREDSRHSGSSDKLHRGVDELSSRAASACGAAACREAAGHHVQLASVFVEPSPVGLRWLLATGYLDAWRRLHAIEEALLFLEPPPCVLRYTLDDEMSLSGSTIPQSATLLKRLRTAGAALSVEAVPYLMERAPSASPPAMPSPPSAHDAAREDEARAALAQVRGAINEFRDGRREALVRARNRLFSAAIFSGLTGCTLLVIAILSGASKRAVLAASVFYLIGGLVGLVKLLQSAATGATAAQDDYGLGVVRLIQTPLLAGLAAIGGVVLVKLGQGQGMTLSLQKTFDLGQNPYGLVAAAFFGLTPSLLLSSLQQRVDQYRTDLSKSTPTDSHGSGETGS